MKVKLFTHTDLDGIACAIVAKVKYENVEIEYCQYNDINEKVTQWLDINPDFDNYIVFITDISVNEEVADRLNRLEQENLTIYLYDHHKTAEWLNKYRWALVKIENQYEKTCGTELFYLYSIIPYPDAMSSFVEHVRMYDTWDWKEQDELYPKQLNDLMYILGRDKFVNRMVDYIKQDRVDFLSMADFELLEIMQEQTDKYIDGLKIFAQVLEGYTVGVVYADRNISEIGSTLSERHPFFDFFLIININQGTVSYRTTGNIDLSEIAKRYGGGGHPKASGSQFNPYDLSKDITDIIYGVKR